MDADDVLRGFIERLSALTTEVETTPALVAAANRMKTESLIHFRRSMQDASGWLEHFNDLIAEREFLS